MDVRHYITLTIKAYGHRVFPLKEFINIMFHLNLFFHLLQRADILQRIKVENRITFMFIFLDLHFYFVKNIGGGEGLPVSRWERFLVFRSDRDPERIEQGILQRLHLVVVSYRGEVLVVRRERVFNRTKCDTGGRSCDQVFRCQELEEIVGEIWFGGYFHVGPFFWQFVVFFVWNEI